MYLNHEILFQGKFGLEKENVRVDEQGKLSNKAFPSQIGNENPYITRDFSESQIEMITPPRKRIDEAFQFLFEIEKSVTALLDGDYLWPQSNPPILPDEMFIPLAGGQDASNTKYRAYLSEKYGAKKAIISGIHFNLSFSDEFLQASYISDNSNLRFEEYRDELYVKVTKYFMKYRWFFIYLLSASPIFHHTYVQKCVAESDVNEQGDCTVNGMKSLRNSVCGYRNKESIFLDYQSYSAYRNSIQMLINQNKLCKESELYSAVRMKEDETHTRYLEMRFLDINPLFMSGVALNDLKMLHMFAIFFSQLEDFSFDKQQQEEAERNQDRVSIANSKIWMISEMGRERPLTDVAMELAKQMEEFFLPYRDCEYPMDEIFDSIKTNIKDVENTYSHQITKLIQKTDYIQFHLTQAKKWKEEVERHPFTFYGYEDMELSTQILMQATITSGLFFEVLDRKENFIRLIQPKTKQVEYVKNATKTSADSYSQVLVMENKSITKQILHEAGLFVPMGFEVVSIKEAEKLFKRKRLPEHLVVKPNMTNFGDGITILLKGYTYQQFYEALEFAFQKDQTLLLEPFLEGREYRFLIIGDEVAAVLHRRAANVVGDGKHTIEALVEIKNESHLRGKGYQTPLEKIALTEIELNFLENQGLTKDSILKDKKRIYLRENSNISTGGDSIDMSEKIHSSYKDIALRAAKVLDVAICGIDMIIADEHIEAKDFNYGILEANYNPAIHIHNFPYRGKNRKVEEKIFTLLFGI